MATLTVVYPYDANATFDEGYYVSHHIPLVHAVFGDAVTGVSVHVALGALGGDPGYAAIVQIEFASMAAFQQAMASPRAGELQADVANFTTVTPVTQLSRKAM